MEDYRLAPDPNYDPVMEIICPHCVQNIRFRRRNTMPRKTFKGGSTTIDYYIFCKHCKETIPLT